MFTNFMYPNNAPINFKRITKSFKNSQNLTLINSKFIFLNTTQPHSTESQSQLTLLSQQETVSVGTNLGRIS